MPSDDLLADILDRFGHADHSHSEMIASSVAISPLTRWLCPRADLYLTILWNAGILAAAPGPRWLFQNPKSLVKRRSLNRVILPNPEHEAEYRAEVLRLFKDGYADAGADLEWANNRCLLLITNQHPQVLRTKRFPLLRFDITDAKAYEVEFFAFTIMDLSSSVGFGPWKRRPGMLQPLLDEEMTDFPYAYGGERKTNALDLLSFLAMVCPSITIHFQGFNAEMHRRFDSVVEETVYSRNGALPFTDVLEFRRELAERSQKRGTAHLPDEDQIRDIWP